MFDKELEAIYKCHEILKELDNSTRMRVFKYLLDRYGLINLGTMPSDNPPASGYIGNGESSSPIISPEPKNEKSSKIKATPTPQKKKGNTNQSYSLITDLNLNPSGKPSLKEFFESFITNNNFEYNLVIVYYLERILKEPNINVNHIYTCFKHLGKKVPNLVQGIRDIKARKGWIDSSDSNNFKITVSGENFLEHNLAKTTNGK